MTSIEPYYSAQASVNTIVSNETLVKIIIYSLTSITYSLISIIYSLISIIYTLISIIYSLISITFLHHTLSG